MKKYLVLVFTIALIGTMISCSDDESVQPQRVEYTTAEQFLEDIDFSGSVLIRKGNEDVVRSGFGFADKSASQLNQVDHVYRIGSMTKSFTAMALVHLKRDGLIQSYDQLLSDFDDEFPYGDQITLKHLLTHSSGIPDYTQAIEDYAANNNYHFSTEEILDVITESMEEDGLQFDPGTQHAYSNSNYMILGLLIEDLTDMSYHEYLDLKIINPLGLSSTAEGPNDMSGSPYAKGYCDGVEVSPYQMQLAYSAGDLISTLADMEKWGDVLLGDDYLTTVEKAEIFADPASEGGYYTLGFGWFTIRENGTLMYYHGGDIDGYSSLMVLLPETNSLIVVLGNDEDGGEKRNLIQEAMAKYEFQ